MPKQPDQNEPELDETQSSTIEDAEEEEVASRDPKSGDTGGKGDEIEIDDGLEDDFDDDLDDDDEDELPTGQDPGRQ